MLTALLLKRQHNCWPEHKGESRPMHAFCQLEAVELFRSVCQDTTHGLHIAHVGTNRLLRESTHADGTAIDEAAQLLTRAQRYNPVIACGVVNYIL